MTHLDSLTVDGSCSTLAKLVPLQPRPLLCWPELFHGTSNMCLDDVNVCRLGGFAETSSSAWIGFCHTLNLAQSHVDSFGNYFQDFLSHFEKSRFSLSIYLDVGAMMFGWLPFACILRQKLPSIDTAGKQGAFSTGPVFYCSSYVVHFQL